MVIGAAAAWHTSSARSSVKLPQHTGIFGELNCFLASVKLGLVLTTDLKFRLCVAGRGRSLVTLSAVRWT